MDQFRSLSHETAVLETNNHTLEHEATQSKVQLSVTLDHVSALEAKLESQDTMLHSYEKEIVALTAEIARLERALTDAKQCEEQCEAEMCRMKNLAMKLDRQKDTMLTELDKRDTKSTVVSGLHFLTFYLKNPALQMYS